MDATANTARISLTLAQGPVVNFPFGLAFAGTDDRDRTYSRMTGSKQSGYLVTDIDDRVEVWTDEGSMIPVADRSEAYVWLDGSDDSEGCPVFDVFDVFTI